MGLTISVREQETITIGDEEFLVGKIFRDKTLVLQNSNGDSFEIVHDRSNEVAPGVRVSSNDRSHSQQARVVIEADPSIPIRRGPHGHTKTPSDRERDQAG